MRKPTLEEKNAYDKKVYDARKETKRKAEAYQGLVDALKQITGEPIGLVRDKEIAKAALKEAEL